MVTPLTDRLAALSSLKDIPRRELAWLVKHGHLETFEAGKLIGVKGDQLEYMFIILSGCLIVRIDRGAGPKVVSESRTGTVAGRLPYSRLIAIPGDAYVEGKTEALIIHQQHFPSLIKECPLFTAHTVHRMIDRTRQYNTSDLQEEKLISLGKLAAGLAHELNNPASTAIRNARLLVESQTKAEAASHLLAALNQEQFKYIEEMRDTCLKQCVLSPLSSLQKSDLEDDLNAWLVKQGSNPALAGSLADTALTPDALNNLAEAIPSEALDAVLKWIIASCSARTLALETEKAARQIYKLVDTVKKFTYMDNLSDKESVNVESGIRDALRVLESKTKTKQADIRLTIADHLPNVSANGADLNQVWFNLLDNALDAISDAGTIRVEGRVEQNQVSISIIDNGPGIPPDKISRIFDPFYTTKPPGQGTGLGLDLTRRLLRRFKSDVTVQSQPGKTEFCVRLKGVTSVSRESVS